MVKVSGWPRLFYWTTGVLEIPLGFDTDRASQELDVSSRLGKWRNIWSDKHIQLTKASVPRRRRVP